MLIRDGIPTAEDLAKVLPSEERLAKGPIAITECFQQIACNPCVAACPHHAILMVHPMNQRAVWRRKETGNLYRVCVENELEENKRPPIVE